MKYEKEKDLEKRPEKKTLAELRRFLLKTLILTAGCLILFTCILRVHRAVGNSMSPFVRDGDLCVFLKTEAPSLGDVILYLDQEGKQRIGRITAVAGQTLDFSETGGYTTDGYQPSEEIPYETWRAEESEVEYPLKLSEDEVFIMNDFRSITDDSRTTGPVKKDSVEGKLLVMMRRRGF